MARFSKNFYFASMACLFSVWFITQETALAQSGTYSLSYSGRLTQADGAPVSGPVDVTVKFWTAVAGGNALTAPIELTNTDLNQGVFTLAIDLNPAQVNAVFGQGTEPVFIEISAAGKTYPRQQYSFVPFALRVPVDAKTLAFDGDGKLGLSLTSQPSANQFLTKDSNGRLAWGSPVVSTLQGQSIASTAPTSGQILTYSGGQWVPQTLAVAGAAGGTVTNVSGTAPLSVTSGTTTPVISMAQASGSANGYLSSADWAAFNAKPSAAVTSVATGTGLTGGPITSSGTISLSNTSVTPGSYTRANISVDAQGRLTAAANGASLNLASEVSGTLPVGSGGTGATSFTNNGILVGSGSLPLSTVTGSQYQVLTASAGGTPSFGSINLDQSAAVTGILARANGGTGVNSTATFPSSGVIVTEGATETLTNKTLSGATIAGASSIGGSTTIDTAGTFKSSAATVAGTVTILGNSTTANKLVLNDKGSTNSVALKAPDNLASSLTLELPSSSGSNGQVLATNGSGILSWVSAATGSVTNVTGTAPISVATGTSTPVISMSQANGTTNGYLSSADWTMFNSKQAAGNYLTGLTGDVSAAGPGSSAATLAAVAIAGTSTKVTYDVKGRVTSGTSLEAADLPSHSAALITSGTLAVANGGTGANLSSTGGAGQYLKQTTSGGSVTVGTIAASDITSSLGYTPLNKAGDTVTGALNLGANDLINAGNIQMAASKTLALSTNSSDPPGLVAGDVGKTWFNSSTNQIKYWNGSAAVALGAAGSGLSNLNGQTGNTQTFAVPGTSGTAPTWSSASNAHTLNIPMASAASVTAGLLSNADYASFNGKISSVAQGTGIAVATSSGTATVSLGSTGTAGTYSKVTTDAYGRVNSGTTLSASDIPPLSAAIITSGTLTVANGGTGATTLAANNVILGNGTSAVQVVAPGSSGNVLTSNGTTWQSTALPASVTSVTGTAPISVGTGTSTPVISVSQASGTSNGYLSTADWTTFNSKQSAGNYITALTGDVTASGAGSAAATLSATGVTAGTYTKVTVDAKGRVTTSSTLVAADIPPISAATITSGTLAAANGGTGVNSTATFPTSGVIVTEAATETLTNKTLTAATINGASAIGGSTTINTSGTINSGAQTVAGNITILGNSTTANKLLLNDKGSTNSVALKAPDTLASSLTLELPSTSGTSGQVLSTNGSGTLSWISAATGSVTNVTGTAPISVATGTSTPVISMSQANGTTNGYLSSTDWTTFNSKQPSGNYITALTGDITAAGAGSAAATLSATGVTAGTYTKVTVDAKGRATFGTSLVAADIPPLPISIIGSGTLGVANGGTGAAIITNNGVVVGAGTGALSGVTGTSGQVMTVNGSNQPIFSAINLASSAAVSGTLAVANGGTGASALATNNVLLGNGTSALQAVAPGASGNVLTSNGSTWTSAASSTNWAAPGTIGSTTPNTGAFTTLTASGNVGIGTTAPGYGLDVNSLGAAFGTGTGAATVYLRDVANASWALGTGGYQLGFYNNNGGSYVSKMVITNAGNVGIGTAAPSSTLHVNGNALVSSANTQITNLDLHNTSTTPQLWRFQTNGSGVTGRVGNLELWGNTNSSGTWTAGFVVQPGGNVGIGTTTPAAKLDVNGTIRVPEICDESGANCKDISLGWGSASSEAIFFSCSNAQSANSSNLPCYGAASNGGRGNSTYRAISCNYDTGNYTVNFLTYDGSAWRFYSGGWFNCTDGTVRVMKMDATSGSYTTQWSAATGGINYASGNVGIGTTAPGQKLSVAGTIESTSGGVKFPDGTTQSSAAGNLSLRYYAGTSTSLPSGSFSGPIAFNTKSWDSQNAFNGTTFTAPTAGYYQVSACLWASATTSGYELDLYKNGTREIGFAYGMSASIVCGTIVTSCAASDTLDIRSFNSGGASVNPSPTWSWIAITRVGN